MNVEEFRTYCLAKKCVTESFPFDEETLVFKVANKMFALLSLEKIPPSANLKCDPEHAIELRDCFPEIIPGYHMNKKHWNTVEIDSGLQNDFVRKLIDHSYDLIVQSLPKKVQKEFGFID